MQYIARFLILSGTVYNMQELRGENTQQKLFDQLEEVLNPATEPATRKELLQPSSEDNKQMFKKRQSQWESHIE